MLYASNIPCAGIYYCATSVRNHKLFLIPHFELWNLSLTLCYGLVIFPMSEINTFETSDFADRRFSFKNRDGGLFSPTMFYGTKYCVT